MSFARYSQPLVAPAPVPTLNCAKALFLTLQFGRALAQLRSQDPVLVSPSLHLSLVLHREGMLREPLGQDTLLDVPQLLNDYAAQFATAVRLKYLQVLETDERLAALQSLLLNGNASEDLVGRLRSDGTHQMGLLERSLQEAHAERVFFSIPY